MVPIYSGIVLALVLAISSRLLRFDQDRSYYAVVLIVIAAYYVLFAFIANEAIFEEVMIALFFTVVAIAGALRWPVLLGGGIVLHGVFDMAHGSIINNSGVPVWWPSFCASVDIVLGIWVVFFTLNNKGFLDG
jgi:hypothetical protein